MTSIFNPSCGVPVWQQTNASIASECGSLSGKIMAAIVTLLVGIMLAVFIADPNALEKDGSKQLTDDDKKKKHQANIYAGIASAIIVVLAWILFPMIGAWSNRNSWHTAQSMLSGYEARGMSHAQALAQLQNYQQSVMAANAAESAASTQASAMTGAAASIADAMRQTHTMQRR